MTKCSDPDCNRNGSFGYLDKKGYWCKQHSKPDMVDRVHALCRRPHCNKRATFGSELTGEARSCATHRLSSEVDVTNRRCIVLGCMKQPSHGPDGTRVRCALHAWDTDKHWKTNRQSRATTRARPSTHKRRRSNGTQELLNSLRSTVAATRRITRQTAERT